MAARWASLFAAAGMNGPKARAAKVPAAPRIICRRDREEYLMRRSFLRQPNCCARFGMASIESQQRRVVYMISDETAVKLSAVSFTRFSQRIRPIYLLTFMVQRFGSEFAFDLLDKS
jgi:hypothetical protein